MGSNLKQHGYGASCWISPLIEAARSALQQEDISLALAN